jgi:hypothetical protein
MKLITEKEIAAVILRDCGADLDKIEQAGIPRSALVALAAVVAKNRVGTSEETKTAFRRRTEQLKKSVRDIEDLPHMGMREFLTPLAESARTNRLEIVQLLQSYMRKDHDEGVVILAALIDKRYPQFDCWTALRNVLYAAICADETNPAIRTDNLSAGMLQKAAKRRNAS